MSKRRQLLFNEKKVSHACDDANLAARNMCVRVCPYGLDCSIILENTACLISSLIFNYIFFACSSDRWTIQRLLATLLLVKNTNCLQRMKKKKSRMAAVETLPLYE